MLPLRCEQGQQGQPSRAAKSAGTRPHPCRAGTAALARHRLEAPPGSGVHFLLLLERATWARFVGWGRCQGSLTTKAKHEQDY